MASNGSTRLEMKSTLLHKQIRVAKFNSKLAKSLAEHDLLLDDPKKRNQNRIEAKSHLNVYTFKCEKIESEEDRKKVLSYIDSLYENDNADFDLTAFSKTKHKIKKWMNNEKTPDAEKDLYNKLLRIASEHQDRTIKSQSIIDLLLKSSTKVTRLNDKKKALESFIELHNKRVGLNIDSESQLNTRVISTIFKIPNHNKTPLTGEEQQELLNEYYKQNFPDYEIIYSVIHKDEVDGHVHNMINGKNRSTNKCDFVQNQYEYILNKIKPSGFPGLYRDLDDEQLIKFGELIQDDFYAFTNKLLVNKDVEFEKKQYNSPEEKALDRGKIKRDTSKPIADRAYNTATYLEEQKNKNRNENNILIAKNVDQETKNIDLRKEEKTILKRIENLVKSTIDYAAEYASTAYKKALNLYGDDHAKLGDIAPFLAEKVRKEAIAMQPNDQQKEEINKKSKPK
jgi:hypothetical protein